MSGDSAYQACDINWLHVVHIRLWMFANHDWFLFFISILNLVESPALYICFLSMSLHALSDDSQCLLIGGLHKCVLSCTKELSEADSLQLYWDSPNQLSQCVWALQLKIRRYSWYPFKECGMALYANTKGPRFAAQLGVWTLGSVFNKLYNICL